MTKDFSGFKRWYENLTEEQRLAWHLKKTKTKNDYHWRTAAQITGDGDYLAMDEGEAPQSYTQYDPVQ